MLTFLFDYIAAISIAIVAVLASVVLVLSGLWVIAEDESGLVIKRFGPPLASGRIIALDGEAGYQARLLPPGWHFGLWRWRYKIEKVPVVVVQPGEIALVVAADGRPIPPERVLAKDVACDNFQDAEAFLRGGGERGRQLAFVTAGTYRINPALFEVVTTDDGAEVRDDRGGSARLPDAAGSRRHRDGPRRPPDPRGGPGRPDRAGARQLPARAGLHRRRRLPRPAGGGPALGRVEPEPVVRAESSRSR